ncbi:hypothetical protein CWS02_17330 [Enterobacter sp. EA-1]|nr:hypothetical protein CWS02_17330 [Enterobacter sp. EA-1]
MHTSLLHRKYAALQLLCLESDNPLRRRQVSFTALHLTQLALRAKSRKIQTGTKQKKHPEGAFLLFKF